MLNREEIFEYAENVYGTVPEYLWDQHPTYAVLRMKNTNKWYAVIMDVSKDKLGMEGDGKVEIMNVKCEPDTVHSLCQAQGFFPGYHMNKEHWISILLDGTVGEIKILDFLDKSYELLDRKADKQGCLRQ